MQQGADTVQDIFVKKFARMGFGRRVGNDAPCPVERKARINFRHDPLGRIAILRVVLRDLGDKWNLAGGTSTRNDP